MIETYAINLTPAARHADILKKLEVGEQPGTEELAKLSKVKAKVGIVGDYGDMETVRNLLKELFSS